MESKCLSVCLSKGLIYKKKIKWMVNNFQKSIPNDKKSLFSLLTDTNHLLWNVDTLNIQYSKAYHSAYILFFLGCKNYGIVHPQGSEFLSMNSLISTPST